jgi:hypothetical protein
MKQRVEEVREKRKKALESATKEEKTSSEPPKEQAREPENEQLPAETPKKGDETPEALHFRAVEKLTPGEESLLRAANRVGRLDIEAMAAVKTAKDGADLTLDAARVCLCPRLM